jgi:crossover junction endodeoxyribonuclease RuvC
MIVLGCDPGGSGGIAALLGDGKIVSLAKMPETERDTFELIGDIKGGYSYDPHFVAYIEAVHSRPGQGVASMFQFGMNYGGLRMALIANDIRLESVTPQKWQKGIGMIPRAKTESKVEWKQRLKARAQELFPGVKFTLSTSDAILIAEYGRRIENEREGR